MSMFGQRILILIPHADDEVVGAAAAIARARAKGARVYALYLSHGYLPLRDLWWWQKFGHAGNVKRRQKEAHAAAEFLGLTIIGENQQRGARDIWRNLNDQADRWAENFAR